MDGWKTTVSFWDGFLVGAMLVPGGYIKYESSNLLKSTASLNNHQRKFLNWLLRWHHVECWFGIHTKRHSRWHKFQTSKSLWNDRNDPTSMNWIFGSQILYQISPKMRFDRMLPTTTGGGDHTFFTNKKNPGDPQLHPLRKDSCTRGWLEIVLFKQKRLEWVGIRSVQPTWLMIFFEKQPCWGHGHWVSKFEICNNPDSPLILSLTSVSCCPTASYTCNCQAYISQMVLRQVMLYPFPSLQVQGFKFQTLTNKFDNISIF